MATFSAFVIRLLWFSSHVVAAGVTKTNDVVIYGGSPAAITAAIQVKRLGKSVVVVYPQNTIGGLTVNGLGWTDSKDGKVVGGIAREFYTKIYEHYGKNSSWIYGQTREKYRHETPGAQPGPTIDESRREQWTFEPHVAQRVYNKMLAAEGIETLPREFLDRENGVTKKGTRIMKICMLSGNCYEGKQFIDATYEGDLMAAAGIPFSIGRDSKSGPRGTKESLAGVFLAKKDGAADFYHGIDPYRIKGNRSSGLLDGLEREISDPPPKGWEGSADSLHIQSFNFRPTLTDHKENKVRIVRPANYDVRKYELMLRLYEGKREIGFTLHTRLPNKKIDANSHGRMSLDYIGGNVLLDKKVSWANATYAERRAMSKAHREYELGLIYTIQNSKRIHKDVRHKWRRWGLPKDEFTDNQHWPRQVYVREARRMKGQFMMRQHHVTSGKDGYIGKCGIGGVVAGMGSYSMDSHTARRLVQSGRIYDEGFFYVPNPTPYPIPFAALLPESKHSTNFINPVTLSMSHVALGSIRMEPTYMILGQSAGVLAACAIDQNVPVQKVDAKKIRAQLAASGQVVS